MIKVLTKRLEKTLNENQPWEHAGFRSRYSTTNYINVVNQLKEKSREYNMSLCIAFIDYEKAFDSLQTQAVLTLLQEQGIEDVYIKILKDTYYLHQQLYDSSPKQSNKINIRRGGRQGDTILPKLFTAALKSIF